MSYLDMIGFVRGLDGRAGQGKISCGGRYPVRGTKIIQTLGSRQSGEKTMLQPFRKVQKIDCIRRTKEAVFDLAKR
jgi:hypothetical protein